MLFSSPLFVFGFLPIFLLAYYLVPRTLKNGVALLASLVFYAWGAPDFVLLLIGSTAVDYGISHRLGRTGPSGRKGWVALSLVVNLGVLLYFKYANFFVDQAGVVLRWFGVESPEWTAVVLPIGISFFTFQKISYVIDVYRGTNPPARSFLDCLLYVALFPQLIAGPIVRYHDVAQQIRERIHGSAQFWSGVQRFTCGLAKKVLIANPAAAMADPIYAMDVHLLPTHYAWVGAACYYLQIYFDFSGYSDMAIGLGRMMGFEFLENFDRPYVARTFTEFWRRWHISLSNWMREYLYIPLGGNRVKPWRGYLNLWIVFLISGFWHGAAWTFVVWGAYQGVFLTLDKMFFSKLAQRIPDLALRVGMVFLVMFSWVFFRADSLEHAVGFLDRMLSGGGPEPVNSPPAMGIRFRSDAIAFVLLGAALCLLPWFGFYRGWEERFKAWSGTPRGTLATMVATGALFLLTSVALVNSDYNPFIYFRF